MSTDDPHRALHEQNRRSWNAVTAAHNSHKLDQAGFLRRGGSTLFPEEVPAAEKIEPWTNQTSFLLKSVSVQFAWCKSTALTIRLTGQ